MEPTSRLPFQLKWPKDLDQIKLTQSDVQKLQRVIENIYLSLASKTPNIDPYVTSNRGNDCPRRLTITHRYCFVFLNSHGGMPHFDRSGSQQKRIKFVWECREGAFWLKKKLFTEKQKDCLLYLSSEDDIGLSSLGFPRIFVERHLQQNGKIRYLEKQAELSLREYIKKYSPEFDVKFIIGLLDALRKIHSCKYKPASFFNTETQISTKSILTHTMFHGDISPNNVICEKIDGEVHLMLTDFHSLGDLNFLIWTPGWASPEFIRFAMAKNQDDCTFLKEYGAKKDTWAIGLLIGSILRGCFHPKYGNNNLPCFSFITDKLKFDSSGQRVIDETGIANITQEEIDTKLDSIIAETQAGCIRELWKLVKAYLRVDPNKRPTVAEHSLVIG